MMTTEAISSVADKKIGDVVAMPITSQPSIKFVRLLTGEELIGRVDDMGPGAIKIYNPLVVIVQPPANPQAKAGVGFLPWVPYVDKKDGLTIKEQHILFIADPVEGMTDAYIQVTTGIVAVKKPGLILPS